jgi:hypothetical protein
MRYEIKPLTLPTESWSDLNLDGEIELVRHTISDLVSMLNQQVELPQRIAIGSMIRSAVTDLSTIIDKAARMPPSTGSLSRNAVHSMLKSIEQAVVEFMPDGVARTQLISIVESKLKGISVSEAPQALVLRTCEMMDQSVPLVE